MRGGVTDAGQPIKKPITEDRATQPMRKLKLEAESRNYIADFCHSKQYFDHEL